MFRQSVTQSIRVCARNRLVFRDWCPAGRVRRAHTREDSLTARQEN